MSDSQHDSTPHADNPAPSLGEAERVARRRKLVGLALSGAPLMMSLPTAVSAQTVSSAYRAAQNDANLPLGLRPLKESSNKDGWLRVPATKYTPLDAATHPLLYLIGTIYYKDDGTTVSPFDSTKYGSGATTYLLVLFPSPVTSTAPGTPFPSGGGLTQGLHASAWSSVLPGGGGSFNSVAWVS